MRRFLGIILVAAGLLGLAKAIFWPAGLDWIGQIIIQGWPVWLIAIVVGGFLLIRSYYWAPVAVFCPSPAVPEGKEPKSNGEREGDWLAKIYAIGDRVRWPSLVTKKSIKIKTAYVLIGLAIIFLTSLGLQFRLDRGWLLWLSTIIPVISLWLVGKKTTNPVVNVLSIILFCVWALFFTLIVIMGLPFQTQI